MKKLLAIVGPTATGKTNLAIKLAKKFSGEILSFDSRQIYKGMNIGTGKDIKEAVFKNDHYLLNGIKIWLYDLVEPNQDFNVADYVKKAKLVLSKVWQDGKLPILVGGTGFYLRALVEGINTLGIKPDLKLREKLTFYSIEELQKIIKDKDSAKFKKMNYSDQLNPRRLIRAIEIADSARENVSDRGIKANLLTIGLKAPFKFLYQKIDDRVEERVKQGLEKEIKSLLAKGYGFNNSVLGRTLGYQQWKGYFDGGKDKDDVLQKWKYNEHAYARRQMTWFKTDKKIIWFDIDKKGWETKVADQVFFWYTKKNAKEN